MVKILTISDDGVPSGYGRISMEINRRLVKRGYNITAASLTYDGLLPVQLEGEALPYWVAALGGKSYPDEVLKLVDVHQPDIIWVTQDFPYAQTIRSLPIDWSKRALMVTTPVDGTPIYPPWLELMKQADGRLTISQFGVDAFKEAGVEVKLCRPGVNLDKFFPLPEEKRLEIRQRLGIAPDAFVMASMCMHQGRKSIPQMLWAFFHFSKDKPSARYLLDMEPVSPIGWDLLMMCRQQGWDTSKLLFKPDVMRLGVTDLRDRYNIADVHIVLAFREGYGLPISEAMACGVVSGGLNWCAPTEQVADGRGILIDGIEYFMPSTWGGALDVLPDYKQLQEKLQWLYDHPDEKRAMAQRGMAWARQQTWDRATDAAAEVIESVIAARKRSAPVVVQQNPQSAPSPATMVPLQAAPDGVKVPPQGISPEQVALVEGG